MFPEIKTERLLLSRLKISDWEMIRFLRSDIDVNKYVKRSSAETKEKALSFIHKMNNAFEDRKSYYWKITEKNKSNMIGSICLWNFSENNKTAEIGYDLSRDYQRKGIMTESLKAIIDFGFEKLNLEIIVAYTHYQNERSIKMLENNGFKLIAGKQDKENKNNIIYKLQKAQ